MTEGFDGIIGHGRSIDVLRRALRADRLHHAYLFVGPQGVGKRKVAMALAQAINCTGPTYAQGAPCGVCTHCTRIAAAQHPDVTLIEPDRSKARPTIKIGSVRELIRQVHYRPYEGRRRVIIIDDAEALTEEAANALLKTLEEPTGETLFVLITSRLHMLLATIRSRSQPVRFAPLGRKDIESHLLAHTSLSRDKAQVCAAFADGSIGQALGLAEEGVLDGRRELVSDVAELNASDTLKVFRVASQHARAGSQELQARLDALKTYYRDVVLLRSGASPERVVNVDMRKALDKSAQRLTLEVAIGHIEKIDEVQSSLRGYVDAHLLLEDLLFSLAA